MRASSLTLSSLRPGIRFRDEVMVGLTEANELPAIDEGLQDILLDVQVSFGDLTKSFAGLWEVFDRFADAEIGEMIGSGLGAQQQVVTNVLFDGVLLVIGPNDRVAQMHILDGGLQGIAVAFGDVATENQTHFIGLPEGAVGVEQPFG